MHSVGPAHHDGELVLPRPLRNDVGEATQILTNDVVGLLIEVTVSRIHHIGRGQAIVHPLALLTQCLRNCPSKGHHIVARLLLNLQDAVNIKASLLTNQGHIFLGNLTQLSPGLISQNLYLQPSLVLIFLSPNVRHLGARVSVDHVDLSPLLNFLITKINFSPFNFYGKIDIFLILFCYLR